MLWIRGCVDPDLGQAILSQTRAPPRSRDRNSPDSNRIRSRVSALRGQRFNLGLLRFTASLPLSAATIQVLTGRRDVSDWWKPIARASRPTERPNDHHPAGVHVTVGRDAPAGAGEVPSVPDSESTPRRNGIPATRSAGNDRSPPGTSARRFGPTPWGPNGPVIGVTSPTVPAVPRRGCGSGSRGPTRLRRPAGLQCRTRRPVVVDIEGRSDNPGPEAARLPGSHPGGSGTPGRSDRAPGSPRAAPPCTDDGAA